MIHKPLRRFAPAPLKRGAGARECMPHYFCLPALASPSLRPRPGLPLSGEVARTAGRVTGEVARSAGRVGGGSSQGRKSYYDPLSFRENPFFTILHQQKPRFPSCFTSRKAGQMFIVPGRSFRFPACAGLTALFVLWGWRRSRFAIALKRGPKQGRLPDQPRGRTPTTL